MSSPITLSGFNNIDFSSVLNALMAAGAAFRSPSWRPSRPRSSNQKTFFTSSPRSSPASRAPPTR